MIVEALLPTARHHLVVIGDQTRLTEAAARLASGHTNLLVVCNDTSVMVGVVSKTDIVSRISHCLGGACTAMVNSVMSQEIKSCRLDTMLQDAWTLMKNTGFLHIPIVDQDHRPLGMLTARDVLQGLLGEVEYEEALLRDYIIGIGYR